VTARFNLKPLAHRWATDLCAATPSSSVRQRLTPDEQDQSFVIPPVPRIRPNRSSSAPIVLTDADTSLEAPSTSGRVGSRNAVNTQGAAKLRKLERNLDALKTDKDTLKKANAKLQKEIGALTNKLEKSQASLSSAVAEQALLKERLKTTTTEDKIMREMITTYHTKVMAELTKIKDDVATIRSTPVEIVATHEHLLTPSMSHNSQSSQVNSGLGMTDQPLHGGVSRPTMFSSPSREAHGLPPPRSSPSLDSRGDYPPRMLQGPYDAWSQPVGNAGNLCGVGQFHQSPTMRAPQIYSNNVNVHGPGSERFGDGNHDHWPMQSMRAPTWIAAEATPPTVTFSVRPNPQRALQYDDEEETETPPSAPAPSVKRSRKRK